MLCFLLWTRLLLRIYNNKQIIISIQKFVLFLKEIHKRGRNESKFPFRYQTIDLHSVAFVKFKKSYSMSKICEKLGVTPEIKPHNALNGALAEYECFKILLADEIQNR